MNKIVYIVSLFVLTACSAQAASTATQAAAPTATTEVMAPTEEPTLEAAPAFEAATYRDDANGFEVDYPVDWTLLGGESQSRGYYRQIVSWEQEGDSFDSVPEGGSLLQVAVYLWDPVRDLDARLEMRRGNITGSGSTIVEEEAITLPSGAQVVRMLVQSTESQYLIYFATVGDQYLELTGNGDLDTVEAAMRTLRIDGISP